MISYEWCQSKWKGHAAILEIINKSNEPPKNKRTVRTMPTDQKSGRGRPINRGQTVHVISEPNIDECGVMCGLTLTWVTILGCKEDVVFCERGWIVTSIFVVYVGKFKRIDLATYVTKVHLLFRSHYLYNSIFKCVWVWVVKGWMTYQKIICNIARMRLKHAGKSYGDCTDTKQK